jgi:hypothetical protein
MQQQQQQQQHMQSQLINVEMLRALRRVGKRGESSGDDSNGDGETDPERGSKFKGVAKLRKRFKNKPKVIVQEYLDKVQDQLGVVHGSQFWQLKDFSKKVLVQFGKMKGLWRTHHAMSEALQHLVENRPEHAAAHLALCLQAVHQVALDQGDWGNASLLIPSEDPLARPTFGAGERELESIYAYRKALRELKGRFGGRVADDEPGETGTGDGEPTAWKAKAKPKK